MFKGPASPFFFSPPPLLSHLARWLSSVAPGDAQTKQGSLRIPTTRWKNQNAPPKTLLVENVWECA